MNLPQPQESSHRIVLSEAAEGLQWSGHQQCRAASLTPQVPEGDTYQKITKRTWKGQVRLPQSWSRGPTAADRETLNNTPPKEITKG